MRARLAAALLVLLLAPAATAAVPFKATLKAGTHTPAVNVKWWYTIRVTDLGGRRIRATVTAQIVDPFGGVHPVQFGTSTKNIVNWPFTGTFRDFIKFPPESRGFTLTVRWIVKAKGRKVVLKYKVTPK